MILKLSSVFTSQLKCLVCISNTKVHRVVFGAMVVQVMQTGKHGNRRRGMYSRLTRNQPKVSVERYAYKVQDLNCMVICTATSLQRTLRW